MRDSWRRGDTVADSKLSALTELSVPALEDLLYVVDDPAGTPVSRKLSFNRALGQLNHIACGRLTLATGYSVYAPQPATTSSINTGTDVATFAAAHGWVTGTMVTSATTVDGLTAGTTYYIRAESTTTVTFYDTLAHAEAGGATGLTDLTATTAVQIIPFGVQSTTIKYTPHNGNLIAIPDGTRTKLYTFSELSLALGTLVSGSLYDVFVYDSAGAATLKLGPAWSSTTSRGTGAGTTEVTLTNGVWVNAVSITSGPAAGAGRLLGTIRAISTAAGEDSFAPPAGCSISPKLYLYNVDNQVLRYGHITDATSGTYATSTTRQYRAQTFNQVDFLLGLPQIVSGGNVQVVMEFSTANVGVCSVAIDSTTIEQAFVSATGTAATTKYFGGGNAMTFNVPIGYHYLSMNQRTALGSNVTYTGCGAWLSLLN